jgi:hypothetical protein
VNRTLVLSITSLVSVLLFTVHLAQDIVRGYEPVTMANLAAVPMFALWAYGALVLAGRRSGYVILLLGSLLSMCALSHMMGRGLGGTVAKSPGAFLFIWTILLQGVSGLFCFALSLQGLWSQRRRA